MEVQQVCVANMDGLTLTGIESVGGFFTQIGGGAGDDIHAERFVEETVVIILDDEDVPRVDDVVVVQGVP